LWFTNIIRDVGDGTSRPDTTAGLASEAPARLRVQERVQAIGVTAAGLSACTLRFNGAAAWRSGYRCISAFRTTPSLRARLV
jgi:hypothetical protein